LSTKKAKGRAKVGHSRSRSSTVILNIDLLSGRGAFQVSRSVAETDLPIQKYSDPVCGFWKDHTTNICLEIAI
jgi:hypothetical protein